MPKGPHSDYECPACHDWIEVLPTTPEIFNCPWCNEKLRLVADGELVDGIWRDRSKLVTAGSHWDE